MKFVGSEVWPVIKSRIKAATSRRVVVSAYLTKGAIKLLPLDAGDMLVVNGSTTALKSGSTNPYEIAKFVKKKVRCYSVAGLHAKICVADNYVIIGSANASRNSKDNLIESCLVVKQQALADQVEDWVLDLPLELIDTDRLKTMRDDYVAPKGGLGSGRTRRPKAKSRVWITWVKNGAPEPDDARFEKKNKVAKAMQEDKSADPYWITENTKKPSRVFKSVVPGDQVVIIDHTDPKAIVYLPLRVLSRPFVATGEDGKNRSYLLLEDSEGWLSLQEFRTKMAQRGVAIPANGKSSKQIPPSATTGLSRLWE